MKKLITVAPRGVIAVFVVAYLGLSAKAQWLDPVALALLAFIGVFVVIYTYHAPHHALNFQRESFRASLGIPIGALCTYYLHTQFQLGTILAAGIVGLVASYIPVLFKTSTKAKEMPATLYCGAFLGMTDQTIAHDARFILLASAVSMVVFLVTKSYFIKVGGRLGTFAFAGAFTTFLLVKVWHLL